VPLVEISLKALTRSAAAQADGMTLLPADERRYYSAVASSRHEARWPALETRSQGAG
jgi:hypothetical protein